MLSNGGKGDHKDKDQAFKDKYNDLKLVLKESLRTRTRTRTSIPADNPKNLMKPYHCQRPPAPPDRTRPVSSIYTYISVNKHYAVLKIARLNR